MPKRCADDDAQNLLRFLLGAAVGTAMALWRHGSACLRCPVRRRRWRMYTTGSTWSAACPSACAQTMSTCRTTRSDQFRDQWHASGARSASSYMDTRGFRDVQVETHGELGGVGLEVTMQDGLVKVVAPINGTPAAKAGVSPAISSLRSTAISCREVTIDQAVERTRGAVHARSSYHQA